MEGLEGITPSEVGLSVGKRQHRMISFTCGVKNNQNRKGLIDRTGEWLPAEGGEGPGGEGEGAEMCRAVGIALHRARGGGRTGCRVWLSSHRAVPLKLTQNFKKGDQTQQGPWTLPPFPARDSGGGTCFRKELSGGSGRALAKHRPPPPNDLCPLARLFPPLHFPSPPASLLLCPKHHPLPHFLDCPCAYKCPCDTLKHGCLLLVCFC